MINYFKNKRFNLYLEQVWFDTCTEDPVFRTLISLLSGLVGMIIGLLDMSIKYSVDGATGSIVAAYLGGGYIIVALLVFFAPYVASLVYFIPARFRNTKKLKAAEKRTEKDEETQKLNRVESFISQCKGK